MIKTKIVFIIFILLSIFIFPYSFLFLKIDFISSITPGWNTIIYHYGALIKFFFLMISAFFCWKLSKVINEINIKKIALYLLLTMPAVIITKLNLFELFNFNSTDPENFMKQIQIIVLIKILTNILFISAQIMFWVYYKKSKQKLT
jgi:hypothetical protein